jgi:large subunit ribosomal protein L21
MYAVIKTGGKQYRVAKDDVIVVERLSGAAGDNIELDQVLMLDDGKGTTVGAPLVDGARVAATVVDQSRGDKIIVFKKKRRKNYRRTLGHRQDLTVLRITDILAKGEKAKKTRAKAKADDEAPAAEAAEAAAEEAVTAAVEAPAADAAPSEAAAADTAAEAAPKPKRKRTAKPKAADDDAGDAGKPEEDR